MPTNPETRSRTTVTLVRVLLLAGVLLFILYATTQRPSDRTDAASSDADRESAFTMMGRTERRFTSPSFEGGEVTVVMGRGEIDLRQARMAPDGAELGILVLMGRAVIRVPEDWRVVDDTVALMGKVQDKRRPAEPAGPNVLHLKGAVLMGGATIRN